MNGNLTGKVLRTEDTKRDCTVGKLLGEGSQGEVYQVDVEGETLALKWYFPTNATLDQRAALSQIIRYGSPNDSFLWPLELVSAPDILGFGYLMALRPPEYKSIVHLMRRQVDPTFKVLSMAGFHLANSFRELHAKGLCYHDINFNNVFFDPQTGDVLICDNDNVTVDGSPDVQVWGTPSFMAPEIVRGESFPNSRTDLFSLAVLLFYMLIVHHPLDGEREYNIHSKDLAAMTELYGKHPVFIFDPGDRSNRPVPGAQDNALIFWPIYPTFLKHLFTKAFTSGLHDPQHGRVQEGEWRVAMLRLHDSVFYCAHCAAENFYDADALRAAGGKMPFCWGCSQPLYLPPRIRIEDRVIMLTKDAQLFPHHVDKQILFDASAPVAQVNQHPTDPGIWGLKNLSRESWAAIMPDGTTRSVDPGRSITLMSGIKIQFGKSEGEIRT